MMKLDDLEKFLLWTIIAFVLVMVLIPLLSGCTLQVDFSDNSPKTVSECLDHNASKTDILTIPRSL